jgi:hypothetical protein
MGLQTWVASVLAKPMHAFKDGRLQGCWLPLQLALERSWKEDRRH